MAAIPIPSPFEARTNATFDALMWALSRPGRPQTLPGPGDLGIMEALIDLECRVYSAQETLRAAAARTGAAIVSPEEADHLFLGPLEDAKILERVSCGTDLHPEEGATLIITAKLGTGSALRLSGPGIEGVQELEVGSLPQDFWSTRARVMRYPMGFELLFVDGDQVVGIPRSTSVEGF